MASLKRLLPYIPLLALWFPVAASTEVLAQSPQDIGVRPEQSYDGDKESVGLANGNLNLSIPIVSLKGRQGKPFTLAITYNSTLWSLGDDPASYVGSGTCINQDVWGCDGSNMFTPFPYLEWSLPQQGAYSVGTYGWQMQLPSINGGTVDNGTGATYTYYTQRGFCDLRCTRTDTPDDQRSGSLFERLYFNGDPLNPEWARVILPDGSQLFDPYNTNATYLDSNGNSLAVTNQPESYFIAPQSNTITDSLGRTIQVNVSSSYGFPSAENVSYSDPNGNPAAVKFMFGASGAISTVAPTFANPATAIVQNPHSAGVSGVMQGADAGMLTAIVLPSGLSYTFHYDQYYELDKITYPDGGYTRYDYAAFTNTMAILSGLGPASNPIQNGYDGPGVFLADYRQVSAKHVCNSPASALGSTVVIAGNNCPVQEVTTTYTPNIPQASGANLGNTVTYPDGTSVEHDFLNRPIDAADGIYSLSPGFCGSTAPAAYYASATSYLSTGTYRCPTIDSGTITRDVGGSIVASTQMQYNDFFCPNSITWQISTLGSGTSSSYIYNTMWYDDTGVSNALTLSSCNLIDKFEYIGSNSSQSLLRHTAYGYTSVSSDGRANYNVLFDDGLSPWLKPLKSSETVYDGNGTQLAQTLYGYDDYSSTAIAPSRAFDHGIPAFYQTSGCLQPCQPDVLNPGLAFDSSYRARGNVTSVSKWRNTDGAWLTSTMTYDDVGNVLSVTDPALHTTQSSFLDQYTNGACATQGQTAAFPTSKTLPDGEQSSVDYNSCDGSPSQMVNPNAELTAFTYDSMGHNIRTQAPDLGITTSCSSEMSQESCASSAFPITQVVTKQIDPQKTLTSVTQLDGVGRKTVDTLASDPYGAVSKLTSYNPDGLVGEVSVPFRGPTNVNPASVPGYMRSYDALDRLLNETNPGDSTIGGSQKGWTYTPNAVLATDEVGKQVLRIYDAAGRLVTVCEPGSTSDSVSLGSSCSTNNAEIDYGYDALNNLTSVSQYSVSSGTVPVNRSFVYDSLSRLISASNPESGTVTYSYIPSTGIVCAGNPSLPCSKTDARGRTTTYSYDTNDRLTGKHYSDGTPAASYTYGGNGSASAHTVGRLIAESTTSGGVTLTSRSISSYDSMGRIANETQCVYTICNSLEFGWDYASNLRTEGVGPTGTPLSQISYHVDAANRVDTVSTNWNDATHPQTLFQATNYDVFGLANANYGIGTDTPNGVLNLTHTRNVRGWITEGNYGGEVQTQAGTPASGQVTFYGGTGGSAPPPSSTNVVTVTAAPGLSGTTVFGGAIAMQINDQAQPAIVFFDSSDTPESIAANLAAAVGNVCTDSGQAFFSDYATATSFGNQVTLTDCPPPESDGGAVPDDVQAYIAGEGDPYGFGPDYFFSVTGGSSLGNTGYIQISLNGTIEQTYIYSQTDTAASVALVLTAGSPDLTISANNGTITMQTKQTGATENLPYQVAIGVQTGVPVFTASSYSGTLSGGTNAVDHSGTVYGYNLAQNGAYLGNGNIAQVTDSIQGTWNYSYDQVNRLQSASTATAPYNSNPASPATINWAYDIFGNRLSQGLTGATGISLYQPTANYNTGNNRSDLNCYDASGDVLGPAPCSTNTPYAYDAEGRVSTFNGNQTWYIYDAEGHRVGKTSYEQPQLLDSVYVLGPGGETVTEQDGSGRWVHTDVTGPEGVIATYDPQGVHFYLHDWLGTRRAQANYAGLIEGVFPSLPFGETLPVPSGLPQLAGATERQFTGKERDIESGNDYFGARYYASNMGRWMSPDWSAKAEAVPYAKLDDPQSLNLYGYMLNNPLGGADADGHDPWLSSEARLGLFRLFHPTAASGIGRFDSTGGSNNISTHAGWVAIHTGLSKVAIPDLSAQSHSGDDWGSERNAVRHVLWQADITKQFGADIATQAGNAHEQNPDVQLGSDFRTFPNSLRGLEAADQSVDLLNNQIGRSLGSSMTGNPVDDVTSVLNFYHTVGLFQVVPNGNGFLSVQQVRLSDGDYNNAMSNVHQMQGPNGSVPH